MLQLTNGRVVELGPINGRFTTNAETSPIAANPPSIERFLELVEKVSAVL